MLTAYHRRGIAHQLIQEALAVAQAHGRTLLTMDTRQGGAAERLCESLGFTRLGVIPAYARSTAGSLEATTFFYHQL